MIRALLLIAAALGLMWWLGSVAKAEELPPAMHSKPFPLPCFTSDISKELETYEIVFEGVLQGMTLYSLYVRDDGKFIMTMRTTIFPDVCVVAAGDQHNLIGIVAPNTEPEQPESGS